MIQQTSLSQHVTSNTSGLKRLIVIGLVSGLIATSVNGLLYFIPLNAQGGLFIQSANGSQSLPLVSILAFSFFPSIAATLIYWLLDRFTKYPKAIFLGTAAMVFVGFFFGPLNAASSSFTLWTLELMHVIAAAPIVVTLLNTKKGLKGRTR